MLNPSKKSTPSFVKTPGLVQGWMRVPLSLARAPSFSRIPVRDNASASSKRSLIFPMNDSSDSWRTAGAWSTLASRIHTSGGDESCLRWEWTEVMLYDCVVHFIGDTRFLRTRARAAVPPEELSVVLKGSGVCARLCFLEEICFLLPLLAGWRRRISLDTP